ncbi:MAG: PQQ-binding-like beta-propeller repeat protein [Fuerstiella sp.]|nr:PQQ-binding-like beta-propeller repeat protein [Fuerstiella sp.]
MLRRGLKSHLKSGFQPDIRIAWAVMTGFLVAAAATVTSGAVPDESSIGLDETADPDPDDRELLAAQTLNSDRKTILTLRSLRERLTSGQTDGLGDDFTRLQAADTFSMVPATKGGTLFVPLYRALFDLFQTFPKAQARSIVETGSTTAQQWLQTAINNRSIEDLPRLIHRFPGTDASFEAHLVIAKLHLHHGHQLAAQKWLTPLTKAQIDHPIRQVAMQILRTINHPNATIRTAPQQAPDSDSQPRDITQGPTGNTVPEHFAWQYRPFVSPVVRKQIAAFHGACWSSEIAPQTTWNSVVDGNALFQRTMRGVAAIDPVTGNARWHSSQLPNLNTEITESSINSTAFRELPVGAEAFAKLDNSLLATTFCRDSVVGRLSADEERIYVIAEEPRSRPAAAVNNLFFKPLSGNSFSSTKLVGLEKASGRRVWTTGSSSLVQYLGPCPAGSWFAGPPLVVGRQLLNSFEWNGEVRLGCFASNTGELLWSTLLAIPHQTIDKDAARRQWSAKPQRHGGLIWIPTTTGNVCCIDELARSVLWSTSVERSTRQYTKSIFPARRGRPTVFTPSTSLRNRWAVSELFHTALPARTGTPHTESTPDRDGWQESTAQHRLVVFPERSHDIVFVDATNGTVDGKLSAAPGAVRVHVDETHIVLAETDRLRCLTCRDGSEVWSQPLTAIGGRPTGHGVLQTSLLQIPVSNGTIVTLKMQSGEVVNRTPSILPTRGWGHLLATGKSGSSDLFYVAPDRVMKLSQQAASADAGNTLERAQGLMASERWTEAIQTTDSIVATDPDYRAAQDVRFQCALQLCLVNPAEYLPKLRAAAHTDEQVVHVRVLQVALLLKDKRYRVATDQLVDILRLSPSTLAIPTPQIWRQYGESSEPETDLTGSHPTAVRSLQTWAASELSRLLERSPDVLGSLTEGEALSVPVLLSIHQPLIRSVLHQQIREADSDETAIQLLCHSIDLSNQTGSVTHDDRFATERKLLNDLLTARKNRSPHESDALYAAQELLLTTLMHELPVGFLDADLRAHLPDAGNMDEQFSTAMNSRYAEWKVQPYEAVPVTRSQTYIRNRTLLSMAELDDPFLRHFEWAVTSGEFGRLQARDVLSTDNRHWSIPGRLQVYGAYSNRSDLLQRTGSILLLQTYREIIAVSVLDQKILWRRAVASTSAITVPSNENFAQYDVDRDLLPSHTASNPLRVIGSDDRWCCVLHGRQIEMLDTFTGSVLWTVELPASYTRVKAGDMVVIAGSEAHQGTICFNRRSGERIEIENAADLAARTICSVGNLMVCWTRKPAQTSASVQWIHPVTGNVKTEVSLADFQRFQFLDDRTLCGFNDKFEMLVINLRTRKQQMCSFHADGDTSQADGRKKREATEPLPREIPLWAPRNMQVAADRLNFYVSNRVGMAAGAFRQPSGHKFTRFRSSLRAVSRQDGLLRWWIRNDGVLLASTDQPNLPILVLVDDAPMVAIPATRNVFRGFAKLSGDKLFEQPVPSKQGLRYTWLDSFAPNSLDIAVHGMRVRVRAAPATTAVP